MIQKIVVFWFRRDLRINDNHGFYQALSSDLPVLPIFIFDTEILNKVPSKTDARVTFIYNEVQKLKAVFEKKQSSLNVFYGKPLDSFEQLVKDFEIIKVFANKDYEPYGLQRDIKVQSFLNEHGIEFSLYKDHVIFEENEIVKDNAEAYSVFTPYSKTWKKILKQNTIPFFPSDEYLDNLFKVLPLALPDLKEMGFQKSEMSFPSSYISRDIIQNYAEVRDLPGIRGTTRLGIHLRFGTISIRELTRIASELSEVFLNQLIWRDFFISVLWHFPEVVNKAFKPKYDFIKWRNNEKEFRQWSRGETGYPLVDAGMRELNETGFMHNRVRMVTASFLIKHLLIDWRWGEAYFAEKLLDYELASNNGNWQWVAGSGCDAAPYFRIFNPESQQKKFDADKKYISKWLPEYETSDYPQPIIEHQYARERALTAYKLAMNENAGI